MGDYCRRYTWTYWCDLPPPLVQRAGPVSEKGSLTKEEDGLLKSLHDEHGSSWAAVSGGIPGRTDVNCRNRWLNVLDPTLKKRAWTTKEDDLLKSLHDEHGDAWADISAGLPRRNNESCRSRWNKLGSRRQGRPIENDRFTYDEDRLLEELYAVHGNNWAEISAHLPGRTTRHCRLR